MLGDYYQWLTATSIMKKFFSKAIGIALVFAPGIALAAYNDVTLTTDTKISVGGASVSVSGSSASLETIVVAASTFTVTMLSGSSITVNAPDVVLVSADQATTGSNS